MVTLVSAVPFRISEYKPGITPSRFEFDPVTEGDVNVVHIKSAEFSKQLMDGSTVSLPQDVIALAKSICHDYNTSQVSADGSARPAFFYLEGILTKDEVKKLHATKLKEEIGLQINWFKRLLELADSDWSRTKDPRIISNVQRTAARYLKIEREWSAEVDITKRRFCPACTSEVSTGAAICKFCGCVVDPERAKNLQFANTR